MQNQFIKATLRKVMSNSTPENISMVLARNEYNSPKPNQYGSPQVYRQNSMQSYSSMDPDNSPANKSGKIGAVVGGFFGPLTALFAAPIGNAIGGEGIAKASSSFKFAALGGLAASIGIIPTCALLMASEASAVASLAVAMGALTAAEASAAVASAVGVGIGVGVGITAAWSLVSGACGALGTAIYNLFRSSPY